MISLLCPANRQRDLPANRQRDLRKPPALPPKPPSRPARPSKRKDPEIEAIMEAMDRELAQTEVGKSFERESPRVGVPFLFFSSICFITLLSHIPLILLWVALKDFIYLFVLLFFTDKSGKNNQQISVLRKNTILEQIVSREAIEILSLYPLQRLHAVLK